MLFEVFKLGLAGVVSVRDSTDSLVEIYVTAASKSLSDRGIRFTVTVFCIVRDRLFLVQDFAFLATAMCLLICFVTLKHVIVLCEEQ